MSAIRLSGYRAGLEEFMSPGDTRMQPAILQTNATVGAATIPAAQMLTEYLYRSGSTAGYTDTFDSATNIYNALIGNGADPEIVNGLSFKLRIINSVAFAETITLGGGMAAGLGVVSSVSASTWREFLFTFVSAQKPTTFLATTTNGSASVVLSLGQGQSSIPMGPAANALNLMTGAALSGTGIQAGSTILGLTQGQGGIIGFTMSATANASGTNAISAGPNIKVDGIGSGTL